jgi:hypothetical protein
LLERGRKANDITLKRVTEMLLKTHADAERGQDVSNARQCAMDLAKLHGLIVDKTKVESENIHWAMSDEPMSAEEWESEFGGRILWAPQKGPQEALIKCPAREVLFGGARGGGKTDGTLGRTGIRQKLLGGSFNGIIFRQEMPQADDMIERAQEIFRPLGATYNKVQSQFTFPSGGRLRFSLWKAAKTAQKYQGQNLTDVAIDEAGNYAQPDPIDKLWGALRGD